MNMVYRLIRSSGNLCLLLSVLFTWGCASTSIHVDQHRDEWIARPLSELKEAMSRPGSYASKVKWKETTYPLANGNSVFVEPLGQDCIVHWEINPKNIIIGAKAVGSGCTQEQGPGTELLRRITPLPSNW